MGAYMHTSAILSEGGRYRYKLSRRFGQGGTVCWIMLNPSTADADDDDPTIRKVRGFTERMGYGAFDVVNLFAFRTKSPKVLKAELRRNDIIGPVNDRWIQFAAKEADATVAAWGTNGGLQNRDLSVCKMLGDAEIEPLALRLTAHGHPWHPLMCGYAHGPLPWKPERFG